jgi:hypothetical protein
MIYKIDYSLMGWMQSIGDISIGRNSSHKLESVGTIYITYNLFGRVLTIDGRECGYSGWFSPILSVGDIPVSWEKSKWWGSGSKMLAVGDLKLGYDKRSRIQSIGNLQISYGKFGRMTEIVTAGDRDITHLQQIALTLILLEKEGTETAD